MEYNIDHNNMYTYYIYITDSITVARESENKITLVVKMAYFPINLARAFNKLIFVRK